MRLNLRFLIIALLVTVSCEHEADLPHDKDNYVPLVFNVESEANLEQTKVAVNGSSFPASTDPYSFGVFVYDAETTNAHMEGYDEINAQMKVTTNQETTWTYLWKGSGISAYHNVLSIVKEKAVDIYAYHPYTSGQKNHKKIYFYTNYHKDWMWAPPQKNQIGNAQSNQLPVTLKFQHLMTCIEIILQTEYTGTVNLKTITLTDKNQTSRLYSDGTFDLETGQVKCGNLTGAIAMNLNWSINRSGRTIDFLIPEIESYDGGLWISFNIEGENATTSFEIPTHGGGFMQGSKYKYRLTIGNVSKFSSIGIDNEWKIVGKQDGYTL